MAAINPETGQPIAPHPEHTAWGNFVRAINESGSKPGDGRIESIFRDSALNVFDGRYSKTLNDKALSPQAKASYVAGRVVHDLVNDGSRVPWWLLNHPMAQAAVASDITADAAGLTPNHDAYAEQLERQNMPVTQANIDEAFARDVGFHHQGNPRGIPMGLAAKLPAVLATTALLANSNNTDFLNISGGGRTAGFASVFPSEDNKAVSENPLLELGARYLFGRSGRLLDWEQFTQERPDVSRGDYDSYRSHQWDDGILMGLLKGTSRNIDGEPEATMTGFRVPLSAAASVAGGLGGSIAGAKIADAILDRQSKAEAAKGVADAKVSRVGRGNARLAGAALGGLISAIGSREVARAVNDNIIQPTINPQAVAEEQAWLAQQRQLGLI